MKRLTGKRGEHHFEAHQVKYLIGEINYAHVHLKNGEVVLSCRTLKWFADQWPAFLRIHKNALINPAFIEGVQMKTSLMAVQMQDKSELVISRRRQTVILEQLGTFVAV